MKPEIKRKVNEAVLFYNRYRSPESTATIIKIEDELIHIKFTGPFTSTCGINDWVEDLRYLAEDLGLKLELVEIREEEKPDYRIGVFRVVEDG
ncbi:MAG: hypothetical protein DRO10_04830 [Thermoprotei archaeon]|nr:MAG: hypothetical protein DRO10_04830 [Thermoprotei archaeon]